MKRLEVTPDALAERKRQRVRKTLIAAILLLGFVCIVVGTVLVFSRPTPVSAQTAEPEIPGTSVNDDGFAQLPKKINKSA